MDPSKLADIEPELDPDLADLLEEVTGQLQAGIGVDVEPLAQQHPQHAEQLRQIVPLLGAVHRVAEQDISEPQSIGGQLADKVEVNELGDFRLVREIGRGGMGIVFEAHQVSLDRQVALKVLPFAGLLDPKRVQRFKNEAIAASALEHPHIIPVYTVGCEKNVHYHAMPLIDGESLADLIHRYRQLETSSSADDMRTCVCSRATLHNDGVQSQMDSASRCRLAAQWGIQAANALQAAHEVGLIHRDVKPANLLIDKNNRLWLTDFGLAHVPGSEDLSLTASCDVIGTLRYMSPEQAKVRSGMPDHRTDIYSLGATVYELLTLTPAVDGQDRTQILRQLAHEDRPSLRRIDATIPADLELIVQKAIAKVPDDRYATAGEFAQDLSNFLLDRPLIAKPPSLTVRARKWSRRNRTFVTAALAGLVLTALISLVSVTILSYKNTQLAAQQKEVSRLLARAQLEKGIERLNAGDSQALMDLVVARQTARDLPDLSQAIERMWAIGYGETVRHAPIILSQIVAGGHLVAFSPDGNVVAVGNDDDGGAIGLWDLTTGERRGPPLRLHRPRNLAYSPDGKLLAAISWKNNVRVWNAETGDLIATLTTSDSPHGHEFLRPPIAFSPSGPELVAAVADSLYVWRTTSWQLQPTSMRHQGLIENMQFSRDGLLLATASGDGTAQLWDVRAGTAVGKPMRHPEAAKLVRFSPDGRQLATGCGGETIRIWDVRTQRRMLELRGTAWPLDMDFSPDGASLVTGSAARIAEFWDVRSGKLRATLPHDSRVQRVAFSADGQLLLTSTRAGTVKFWIYSEDPPRLLFEHNTGHVAGDGGHVVLQNSAGTMIWKDNPEFTPRSIADDRRPANVVFSNDRTRLAAFTVDGRMLIWETSTGELLGPPQLFDSPVLSAAFSPDDTEIAVISADGVLHICQLGTRAMGGITTLGDLARAVAPAFHPTGQYIAAGTATHVTVWDLASSKPVFTRPVGVVQTLAFSPDGELLLVGTMGHTAIVLEAATGEQVKALKCGERVASVTFSPDGCQLAVAAEDGKVTLWSTRTWETIGPALKHDSIAGPVAFSPDGKLLATTTQFRHGHKIVPNRVFLWDLRLHSSQVPLELKVEADPEFDPKSLEFDSSGNLICASSSGTAILWPLRKPPRGLDEMRARTTALMGMDVSGDEPDILGSLERWRVAAREVRQMTDSHKALRRAFTFPHDFAIPANIFAGADSGNAQAMDDSLRRQDDLRTAQIYAGLVPESANFWMNLGVVYYRLENWEAVIEAMEKARTLTDDVRRSLQGEQFLFLAMAHWQLGHRAKARELYQVATEWIRKNQPKDKALDGYLLEASDLLEMHGDPSDEHENAEGISSS